MADGQYARDIADFVVAVERDVAGFAAGDDEFTHRLPAGAANSGMESKRIDCRND